MKDGIVLIILENIANKMQIRTKNRRQYPSCRHPLTSGSTNENVSLKYFHKLTVINSQITDIDN